MTPEEIFGKIQSLITDQFSLSASEITMGTSFLDDLGADSVDLVEFVMAMEDAFEVDELEDVDLTSLKTVGDCVKFLSSRLS